MGAWWKKDRYVLYLWDGEGPVLEELKLAFYTDLDKVVAARDAIIAHVQNGHAGVRYTTLDEDRIIDEGGRIV